MRRIPPAVRVAAAAGGLLLLAGLADCRANHGPIGAGHSGRPTAYPTHLRHSGTPTAAQSGTPAPSGSTKSSAGPAPSAITSTSGGTGGTIPASFPNASNTGVPAGHTLTIHNGTLTVDKAGTVIDGLEVHGDINVTANDVIIRNSRVLNRGDWGIIQRQGVHGLQVLDTDVHGNGTDRLQFAVLNEGGMVTIQRCNFSVTSDPISTSSGLITDNYVHDPKYFAGDHIDMLQSDAGPPAGQQLIVRHNTFINTVDQTSALALFQDFGVQHDAIIDGNLLAGGGYALYGGDGNKGTPYNIKVTNNVFSRQVFPNSGQYGPVAYWNRNGSGNVWQNNVWQNTTTAITA